MMKLSLALVALLASPAASLTYLETISNRAPVQASSGGEDAPFFFTNGARDEPEPPSSSAPATTGSYLDNLSGGANVATGSGLPSYLDALAGPSNNAPSGAGMSGYLDSLPASMAFGGSGAPSYADSLNQAGAAAAAAAAESAPEAEASDAASAPTSAKYLEALSGAVDSSIRGSGISGYLDALPRAPAVTGGSGIPSYTASLPTAAAVRGPGLASYADSLSPSAPSSGFAMGSTTGTFDFTLTMDDALKQQIIAAGERRVKLFGTVHAI